MDSGDARNERTAEGRSERRAYKPDEAAKPLRRAGAARRCDSIDERPADDERTAEGRSEEEAHARNEQNL